MESILSALKKVRLWLNLYSYINVFATRIHEQFMKLISEYVHTSTLFQSPKLIQETSHSSREIDKIMSNKRKFWLETSHKLVKLVKHIIELAKISPNFMRLENDDKIILLKESAFELAVLHLSKYLNLQQNTFFYVDTILSEEMFHTSDPHEKKLVCKMFKMARSVAEFKLTDVELALYSFVILFNPDRSRLIEKAYIKKIFDAVVQALRVELSQCEDVTVCDALLAKIPELKEISKMHTAALMRLEGVIPGIEFPPLYRELFMNSDVS